MKTVFLGKEYVALLLIKAKKQIFYENFITTSELNQFEYFLQQEFNNRNLNVIISSNSLSRGDFSIIDGVIVVSDNCCFNLDSLSMDVLMVLYDSDLIIDFLRQLEKEKLEVLEGIKDVGLKLYKK